MEEFSIKREEIFVCSKLWNTKHHPDDVESACRKSLEDLQLEYIDLYLMHWPTAYERGDDFFPKDEEGNMKYNADLIMINIGYLLNFAYVADKQMSK